MDVESPRGSRRVRARVDNYVDRQASGKVFRIENENGKLLRKVRDARHPQEAVALYWRAVGTAMPEAMMGKDLDRRINRARAAIDHDSMRTPELPFEPDPPIDEIIPAQDTDEAFSEDGGAFRNRRGRPRRSATPLPQTDLFDEQAAAEPVDAPPAEPVLSPEPEPEPGPETTHGPEPRLIDAQAVMLQQVDGRNLRATDRADSYLYHVTNGPDAETVMRNGLTVSTSDPMILTERQGVGYWLSVLAEDYDYIMDGPADFVVLRMRRMAVEDLLEHDPHASRSAGCPCYLLTGGAAARERDEAARRRRR